MYRHYDHQDNQDEKSASHPQGSSEAEGVDPTGSLRDIILGSENLLACAQLDRQTLAEGYDDDGGHPNVHDNQGTDDTVHNRSPHWSRSSSYPSASA